MNRTLISVLKSLFCLLACFTLAVSSVIGAGGADSKNTASSSIGPLTWNLRDPQAPLLKLADSFPPGLDLNFALPFDRFGLPVLNSLKFNANAKRYLLMLVSEDGKRGDFFNLQEVGSSHVYASNGKMNIQLLDHGGVKVLRDSYGNQYNFIATADGELRCAQVRETNGTFIRLGYNDDGLIERMEDNLDRSIQIDYADDQVASLTQTWKVAAVKMVQKWNAATVSTTAQQINASYSSAPIFGLAKSVPSNALTPAYTHEMNECDRLLAHIFGGTGAVAAANSFEPAGLARQYPIYRGDIRGDDGQLRRGHLSYAMHLYGSEDGTKTTDIYVPAGFSSHSATPSPTDAAVTFYYPRLGSLTNVTLAVFHIDDFGIRVEGDRVRIGRIGGRGGSYELYKHSHIEFYRGNTGLPSSNQRPALRIDPAIVFSTREPSIASTR